MKIPQHTQKRARREKEGKNEAMRGPGRILISVLSQEERGLHCAANELVPKFSVRDFAAPRGGSFLTRCPWALPLPPQELKPPKVRGI